MKLHLKILFIVCVFYEFVLPFMSLDLYCQLQLPFMLSLVLGIYIYKFTTENKPKKNKNYGWETRNKN